MKRQNIRKAIIIISFLLFPVTIYYFSPVIAVYGAFQGVVSGSLVVFLLMFIASLFLGRFWCGYLCPAGGLQEICSIASSKKAKGGKWNWIKYFIWVPWIGSVAFLLVSSGVNNIDMLYQTYHGISVGELSAYIVYYGVVGLIVVMSLTGGKRAFCHYICWMAPFMIIGLKVRNFLRLPSLNLKVSKHKCINCRMCNKKCQMSLEVSEMVQRGSVNNLECILCGECVDICPKGAIKYCFKSSTDNKEMNTELEV